VQDGYAPETFNAMGKDEIPRDASLVVVAGPRTPVPGPEVNALRKYLEQGGRLLYFASDATQPGPEMKKLLGDHGIEVDSGLVADDRYFTSSPYTIATVFYGDHEIVRLLKQRMWILEFPTTNGLSILREGTLAGVKTEPVVLSSPNAWEETAPDGDPSRSSGEKTGQVPLVAASTRATADAQGKRFDEARLVVFGDGDMLVDANWGHEANRNLVLNALAWASNEVTKITIRPPDRDISTLDIDEGTMAKIRFIAMDLLPLSLLGVGLAIWLTRRNK
jgi:hypothetical protein